MKFNETDMYRAVIGGALISGATLMNMLLHGKITGYSGALRGLTHKHHANQRHYALILGGLLITHLIFLFNNTYFKNYFEQPTSFLSNLSMEGFALTGFLVGLGSSMANGCTSGHGICGLPRLSKRSFVAVFSFMTAAIATATYRYYYPFMTQSVIAPFLTKLPFNENIVKVSLILNLIINIIAVIMINKYKGIKRMFDYFVSLASGMLFGAGLVISGMIRREKVIGFLTFNKNWDPMLLIVFLTAVAINFLVYQLWIRRLNRPYFEDTFDFPTRDDISAALVIGSIIFGVGWGISGLCPGPSIMDSLLYLPHSGVFLGSVMLGQIIYSFATKQ